jgi:hypothetical protein
MSYKEVIICGCPRTGTTALANLLNCDEYCWITHECCSYSFGCAQNFRKKLKEVSSIENTIDTLADKIIPKNMFVDYYGQPYDFFDHLYALTDFKVLGDKSPGYLHDWRRIKKLRPNAKFIVTVRDCRQVVSSCLRWKDERPNEPWVSDNTTDPIDMWVYNTEITIDIKKELGDDCLIVQYEDSVSRPFVALDRIKDFLDYDFKVDKIQEQYYPVNQNTWREELPYINEELTKKAVELMEHFNYEI